MSQRVCDNTIKGKQRKGSTQKYTHPLLLCKAQPVLQAAQFRPNIIILEPKFPFLGGLAFSLLG